MTEPSKMDALIASLNIDPTLTFRDLLLDLQPKGAVGDVGLSIPTLDAVDIAHQVKKYLEMPITGLAIVSAGDPESTMIYNQDLEALALVQRVEIVIDVNGTNTAKLHFFDGVSRVIENVHIFQDARLAAAYHDIAKYVQEKAPEAAANEDC